MRKHSSALIKTPWKRAILVALAFLFLGIGTTLIWATMIKLPDISNFEARKIANSSKITDRTGTVVLYDIQQSVRRTEIPLSDMSDAVKHSIISIEDAQFYTHKGIRITSIIRALLVDILHGSFTQGGSTITQQIVKNTLLNGDKTPTRKIKELILALKLERHFTKDQILQIYLNDAPYGGTIYGVEEASQAFFNKHAKDLDLAESAYLAAIPESPTYYSPFGKHRTELDDRKNLVLKRMNELGYITKDQYLQAKVQKVAFNIGATNSIKAPHFVFYVLDYLQQKYGRDVMENGGYTIKTTLDYEMQQKAEVLVAQYAESNEKKYNASNSGLVAIDPTTGQILTMVGSRNYFDKKIDGAYNIATAKRQPGSSFKPFVYATAFAKGYTPETVLFDVPTEFSNLCSADEQPLPGHDSKECYHPDNFDNKFKGPITLRSALAESRNVPSVKLLYLVGLDDALAAARNLGITTLGDKNNYGLSLVLGGGEVTLLDITGAYGAFANSGLKNQTTGILQVTDSSGTVIEQYEQNQKQVMDKNAVLTLNDVLSDQNARVPTFGDTITIPGVAVKTGTTNNDRDAWILGYTPNIAVGVWSGNNDNTQMRSGGSTVSGPLWKEFMKTVAIAKYPLTSFEKPLPDPDYANLKPILRGEWMGNTSVYVDKVTGMRATDNTPPESRIEKVITDVESILYWVDKSNPRGPAPNNPDNDPQFHLWNPAVKAWWQKNQSKYNITTLSDIPSNYDTLHTQIAPATTIGFSGLPKTMAMSAVAGISITTSNQYPLTSVDIYINNNYTLTLSSPFRFTFTPKEYFSQPGSYSIKAIATDAVYNKVMVSQSVSITQ